MRTAIALLVALGLGAACVACGGAAPGAAVTIMVPWSAKTGEYQAFAAVIKKFTEQTGIGVRPEITRAVAQQLDADLSAGNPPDLVDLPSPGAVEQYEAQGRLRPLTVDLSSYDQPWRRLAESKTGTVYAVPVKADVKSLIWYYTSALKSPPASWAALQNFSRHGTPWCLGLASGTTSGWPGADWVADILLSRNQGGDYTRWLAGQLPWTSAEVKDAWQTWGSLMRYGAGVSGGVLGALRTGFDQAARPAMRSGQCELELGALSATGLTSAAGYDYVVFPSISGPTSPIMVSGDFMGLFTGNPNARKLLSYLASDQAQALWVRQSGGHAFSADKSVLPAAYPPGVQQKIAGLLQPSAGRELCFGASDMMLPDMSAAFTQAVLDYVDNPSSLPALLTGLQKTQQGAGPSPGATIACAQP
jgi:alpha-glucoside transport system substrate-binding protein